MRRFLTRVRAYASRTHRNLARWTDSIIQVEQLVLTEKQSTKKKKGKREAKKKKKESKRLICPCCVSVFHLPTLAYLHPHRLDPITGARTPSRNTNISMSRNIAVEFFFIISLSSTPTCAHGVGVRPRRGGWGGVRWRRGKRRVLERKEAVVIVTESLYTCQSDLFKASCCYRDGGGGVGGYV